MKKVLVLLLVSVLGTVGALLFLKEMVKVLELELEGYERGGAGGEERSKTAVENRAWVHGGRTRGGGGMRPV